MSHHTHGGIVATPAHTPPGRGLLARAAMLLAPILVWACVMAAGLHVVKGNPDHPFASLLNGQVALLDPLLIGSNLSFLVTGVPGTVWEIQRTDNVTGPWTNAGPVAIEGDGNTAFADNGAAGATLFYRAVEILAPVIQSQPLSATNPVGASLTFTATATGTGPLSYQWRFLGTNIVGATNTTLMLTNLSPAQAGDYDVVIANAAGTVTSASAFLAVSESPPVGLIAPLLGMQTSAEIRYIIPELPVGVGAVTLERSSDDAGAPAGDWATVATGLPAGAVGLDGSLPANTRQHYRLRDGATPGPSASMVTQPAASMTLIAREPFIGLGELTAATPGTNFNAVAGTLHRRLVGPRVAGQTKGWSADIRPVGLNGQAHRGQFGLPAASPGDSRVLISAWFHIREGSIALDDTFARLLATVRFDESSESISLGVLNGGVMRARHGADTADLNLPFIDRWVWLGIAIRHVDGVNYDSRFLYKVPGGPVQVWASFTNTAAFYPVGDLTIARYGSTSFGGNNPKFRLGCPSLHTFAQNDFSDVTYPGDVAEPLQAGQTWFVNPATGNDANDGGSPDQAWASLEKLQTELTNHGVMSWYQPWRISGTPRESITKEELRLRGRNRTLVPNGDTVRFDSSGGPIALTSPIFIPANRRGLHLTSASSGARADLSGFKPVTIWTKTPGRTNLYETTDTEAFVVPWEDRKWLLRVRAPDFAAAAPELEATPGSFYNDGTNLYLHPLGSTDPRADGKTYERSRLWSDEFVHAVDVTSADVAVSRLKIGGTALADPAVDLLPGAHYCLAVRCNNVLVDDCELYYGNKHVFGQLEGTDGHAAFIRNTRAEQGAPYSVAGGQTVWVGYTSSGQGRDLYFYQCATDQNQGLPGSSLGVRQDDRSVYYTHNNGGPANYTDQIFEECDFPGTLILATDVVVNGLTFRGGRIGGGLAPRATLEGVRLDRWPFYPESPAGQITWRGCHLTPTAPFANSDSAFRLQGTLTVTNCLLDLRTNSASFGAMGFRVGATALVFTRNTVLQAGGSTNSLFLQLGPADSIYSDYNCFQFDPGVPLMRAFDDGTTTQDRSVSQWQALGYDAHSVDVLP